MSASAIQLMVVGWSDGRIPVDERIESPFFFFFFCVLLLLDSSLVVLSWSSDLLDERRRNNRGDKMTEDGVVLVMDAAD
jgi:hypothetical protein